jgi:Uma2 family endonuclease
MPEDGNRYELIDGELYVSAPPTMCHQTILVNVAMGFVDYLKINPIGRITPGVGVIFDEYDGVIPDLVFATNERIRKTLIGGRFRAAPEIVIEILSPGASNEKRDRHIKRSLFALKGDGEYWIVDPENRCVEVHRRNQAGELVFEKTLMQCDELTCAALPGFSVRVDSLFV